MSTVATPPPLPPAGGDAAEIIPPEPPRRAWWMAKRVLLAALGIVLLAGGATYAVARNEVSRVVEALDQNRAVKVASKVLAPTHKGAPETLLLIGNDERPPPRNNPGGAVLPHSNEMLLVRIDPSKPTISMLSIPRELQVTFTAPTGAVITNRINSAYTYGFEHGGTSGGVKLMVETIKHVLGIHVINHVFVTNFKKFRRAVDEMGCVYMTVDKRYFHENVPGGEQYFEINLQPGYQRLCGMQALEFVSNRHESTSLIRDARDQRFLLEVKAEYGATLFERREKFERILGKAMETDVHSEEQVLALLELLIESAGKPVRQVPFHVTLEPTVDTATPEQISEAVHSFLAGTAPISTQGVDQAVNAARPQPRSHSRVRARHHPAPPALSLTPTSPEALATARKAAVQLPFPLEYPRVRSINAAGEPDMLRAYEIRDRRGHLHPSYVIVVDRGGLGEYYDVQGTSWTEPPILSDPSQTVKLGSRTYSLYYAGEQIRTIAWHEGDGVYWIQNTLTNSVQPREMVALATQTTPVVSAPHLRAPVSPAVASLRDFQLPSRATNATSLFSKLAAALAFIALAGIAALALLLLFRRRELAALRGQVARAMALEARQRPLLAAAGVGASRPAPQSPAAQSSVPQSPMSVPVPAPAPAPVPGPAPAATAPPAATVAPAAAHQPELSLPEGEPTMYRARRSWRRDSLEGLRRHNRSPTS